MPTPRMNMPRTGLGTSGRAVFTAPKAAKKKRYAHSGDNARVILTGAAYADTRPTADIFDAAHEAYDGFGMLLPAAWTPVPGASPRPTPGLRATRRRYHPSQLVGPRGHEVAWDSAYDAWSTASGRLAAQGIRLDGGWDGGRMIERVLGRPVQRGRDDMRLRDILHQRTVQALTPEERRLERAASRLLAAHRTDADA